METRERTSAASDAQGSSNSAGRDSQPLAADVTSPSREKPSQSGQHNGKQTEDVLRAIAARLDRVAAAYLASLQKRGKGSR